MTWLVWRQHRRQLLFGVAALAVLAAFFVGTGRPIHDRFNQTDLPDCLPEATNVAIIPDLVVEVGTNGPDDVAAPPDPDDPAVAASLCAQSAREFYDGYQNVIFAGLLLLILPMLVGMFWGAPLIAREIEHGTHRLVWTQGTSRLRWALTKIGLVSITVMAMTAIYAAMLTWWITPVVKTSGQRFDYIFFDIHGIVVFGYTLFALALGVLAGAVTGRLLPAMATTVVGFLAVRLLVMLFLRDRYLPTETQRVPIGSPARPIRWNDLHGDWIVARGFANLDVCDGEAGECFDTLTLHPARQFWTFQAIEVAIFLTLAIALVAASIYWIRRRIT